MSDEKSIKENKYESQLTGKSRETISEERNDIQNIRLCKNISTLGLQTACFIKVYQMVKKLMQKKCSR